MEPRAELEKLLAELLDGPPDAARNRRLDELLRDHPELQADYLDYMQLHALLVWRSGNVPQPGSRVPESEKAQPTQGTVVRTSRWRSGRGFAAALLVVAASLAAFFFWQMPRPDLFDRLIDWNLELTQEQSPDERNRIYTEQATELKAKVAKAELPPEDRQLAETLLQTSTFLCMKVGPVEEADLFNDIADQLVARMKDATVKHDEERIMRLANAYARLTALGVKANVERARASELDPDMNQKLMRAAQRNDNRKNQLSEIIERNPEPTRKAIRNVINGPVAKKH
jgi:hypothetical protein